MEHSRIPMRGKTKDAEAEALLRLLRQEKDYHRQISIPRIQRKEPLPSIRGKAADSDVQDETGSVFISQMKTGLSDQDVCYSESQFLCSNSKEYNNNNDNGSYGDISPRRKKSYDWKKDSENVVYHKYERQRKAIKTLPPLEPRAQSPRESSEIRPSRPPPSSPKRWGED